MLPTTPIFPKYGISSCEACQKFFSKSIKKLAFDSSGNKVQCKSGDGKHHLSIHLLNVTGIFQFVQLKIILKIYFVGNCPLLPFNRNNRRHLRKSTKDRCPACWLKKCISSYRLPNIEHRARLINTLPSAMRDIDTKPAPMPFSIKLEASESASSTSKTPKIFSSLLNQYNQRLSQWPPQESSTNETEFKSIKILPPINPLVENNVKFGSSPLIRPTITEKPTIMVSASSSSSTERIAERSEPEAKTSPKTENVPSASKESISVANVKEVKSTTAANATVETPAEAVAAKKSIAIEPNEDTGRRLRKKDKERTEPAAIVQPVPPPVTEPAKRQRIDLKGPRVKHVCRSASIVLGQPIATFGDETPLPEMDTPPRPDTPSNVLMELEQSTLVAAAQQKRHQAKQMEASKEAEFVECADSTRLSPPATPITNDTSEGDNSVAKEIVDEKVTAEPIKEDNESTSEIIKKYGEQTKPVTRKVTRPVNYSKKEEKPIVKAPPVISIDFWENYDPAEVSQTGFGLIVSEDVPLKALCFLCGSCGQEPLIFCVCCCEPYHQYCVEDGYNMKHSSLDDTTMSFLDTSIGGAANNSNQIINRLNWMCPRCTVCDMCNMASGTKMKCQKCQKNYHSTCLGTSKRLLGADRPLICSRCLKCKSCGTTNVSKFVGNLPMCSPCFRLRQKGNFCPLCQKCYEDNDFNIKMMECGNCERWVHAKCEGLTDEQYNMLSVLPESIEFICKKCPTPPAVPLSMTWREAVAAEFQSGLLSVVKLLSKSRQACVLLRLSPRKKPSLCTCIASSSAIRCIQFDDDGEESTRIDSDSQDGAMAKDSADIADSPIASRSSQCYCGAAQRQPPNNTSQSLLDIKQKVVANKYFSLADFNYDMNQVIGSASCDELMIAYKEILSEAFPWFQNETKACTDALEEDMYDACNFGQDHDEVFECDQEVPMVNIPDDIDTLFFQPIVEKDTRCCMFCKGIGDGEPSEESRMLYCGQNVWVHANCAMWSAEVFEEIDGSLQKVHSAISRGRMIKCSECGQKGATVGCNARNCGEQYHYPCARKANCAFMLQKTVFCPRHRTGATFNPADEEHNFEVPRAVYVELDRRKRKGVDPSKVQFIKGSLQIKQLGRFVAKLSDLSDAIVPAEYQCKRQFWSTKEPWKMIQYTFRTYIQNDLTMALDYGRNFTVDHSTSTSLVQLGLAQIAKWHQNVANGEETEQLLRQERSMKQLMSAIAGHSEETNEDEPQSNTDLLPPEIKDAIFEDLPHDILDGISMLDIFPKLGNWNENYLPNMTDDDLSQNSNKEFDGDQWMNSNIHVEDALLSATKPLAQCFSRDLKRTKLDVCPKANVRHPQQRSTVTVKSKIDPNAVAKRRKMSMLPDSLLLSFRIRKEDLQDNNKMPMPSEEIKTKPFTWSAANKFSNLEASSNPMDKTVSPKEALDRIKISQLDGMEDISNGSDVSDYYNNLKGESAVKCDRCHCAYRTQESYNRHLATCEALSTSESDSELTSRTPDMQSPQQQMQNNVVITSINGTDYCNIPMMQQSAQQPIYTFNGTTLTQLPQGLQMQNPCTVQTVSSNGLPMQMQGMIINPTGALQQQQQAQSLFAQPITINSLGQQIFPSAQQQITSFAAPQIITSTDQHATMKAIQSPTTTTYRNQLILPQPEKGKKQNQNKIAVSPSKGKGRAAKPAQIKRAQNTIKQDHTIKPMQIINQQNMPIIRTMNGLDGNVIIQQANQNQQPLIVQQLAPNNQNNLVQYVAASDGNNGLQYFALPTPTTEYKPPTQYLTQNSLMPGTFQLQQDASGNFVLANAPTGLQVIPNGSGGLQLSQSTQPQVIGTLIQPQTAAIQCGMMSNEQMMLGTTPTFEMVTNPANGCMLLANQPMYYGLETIVQNTVMQSQQFVSTAMQGVLSQNSSFSATTTQVFQASKIEPIMEMPGGYVVLNNDGTIMQSSAQQPLMSANLLQPTSVPAIQAQPAQMQQTQIQAAPNTNWRFIDDKTISAQPVQQPLIQPQIQVQPQIMQSPKPVVKSSPMVVSKIQPQNKLVTATAGNMMSNPATTIVNQPKTSPVILPKPAASINTIDVSQLTAIHQTTAAMVSQASAPIFQTSSTGSCTITTTQSSSYMQKKSNILKPIGSGVKINSATIKPKIISKPVNVTPKAIKPTYSKDLTPHSNNPQVITVTATDMPTARKFSQQSTLKNPNGFNSPLITIQQVTEDGLIQRPIIETDVDISDGSSPTAGHKYVSPSQYLPKISEQVSNQISITPIPLSASMTITATNAPQQQQAGISNINKQQPHQLLQPQQPKSVTDFPQTITDFSPSDAEFTQKNTDFLYSSSSNPGTKHPVTSSIQLPQAPYAPSFSSGE